MTRSDISLCSWNSAAPLAGNTGLYLSRSMYTKQSGWVRNLWTNAGTCVQPPWRVYNHLSTIPAAVTSHLKQRLINTWASISRHQWRSSSMEKVITCKHEATGHLFEHLLAENLLFSEPTHYTIGSFQSHQQSIEEKHIVSCHFRRSHLKTNKSE